jgi:hypothetical protein
MRHLVRSSGDARPLEAKIRARRDAEPAAGEADPAGRAGLGRCRLRPHQDVPECRCEAWCDADGPPGVATCASATDVFRKLVGTTPRAYQRQRGGK